MNLWFTARGAGLSALILLSLSTCLGALVSRPGNAGRRYLVQYTHRAAAGLGIAVLALHVGTIIADSYAHVGITGAIVPFTAGYRPTWVGLGSLAAYTFVGVAVLGLARGRMASSPRGVRVWRGLHGLAYLGWASAMLHGFTAGTDSDVGWVRLIYLVCLLAVAGSIGCRVAAARRGAARDRTARDRTARDRTARDRFAGRAARDRFAGRAVPSSVTGVGAAVADRAVPAVTPTRPVTRHGVSR